MDLAMGARRVFVAMEHATKEGRPKILERCSLPLTGKRCVHHIVTDLAHLEVTHDGLVLRELAPGTSVAEVQRLTEPRLLVPPDVREMKIPLVV